MSNLTPGQREALHIASLPPAAFEAQMQSGRFGKADIAAARRLRAALLSRGRLDKVEKRDEGKPTLLTLIEKIEQSRRMGTILADAIDAYSREHGVSKSHAADKVLLSPQVSEAVTLEKRMKELERDIAASRVEERLKSADSPVEKASDEATIHDADKLLEQLRHGEIPWNDPRVSQIHRAEKARKGL
jgi:hypothetical protein